MENQNKIQYTSLTPLLSNKQEKTSILTNKIGIHLSAKDKLQDPQQSQSEQPPLKSRELTPGGTNLSDRGSSNKKERENRHLHIRQYVTIPTHINNTSWDVTTGLGKAHAEVTLTKTSCSQIYDLRIAFFQKAVPPLTLSNFLPPRNLE